jgi:hypothetical protein
MLERNKLAQIKDKLFSEEDNVYAIIDGASCPDLRFKIYDWEPKSTCLWTGDLAPDLQEVAPYLVLLDKDSTFTNWLIEQGWGNHWSIFASSKLDFKGFRKQIRKLLLVKSPEGQNLVFRFYDPRVIEVFLPTLVSEQAAEFFDGLINVFFQKTSSDDFISANYDGTFAKVVLGS